MNSPFEIKNHPDSGAVTIKTEGDMNAIARADEIVKSVYRTLPQGRCFSGGISKEDVDKAQAIAEELDRMFLYSDRCHTPEEHAALIEEVKDLNPMPHVPWVRPEALEEFTAFIKKMSAKELNEFFEEKVTKAQAIKLLQEKFRSVKPIRLGRQAQASFGRLKLARGKLDYAHPRQLKNTEGA